MKDSPPLSYKGIKLEVLVHALYHATTPQGPYGRRNDRPTLDVDQVREFLLAEFLGKDVFTIDWMFGRPIKLTFNVPDSEVLYSHLFDRDSNTGEGTVDTVIERLRTKGVADATAHQ